MNSENEQTVAFQGQPAVLVPPRPDADGDRRGLLALDSFTRSLCERASCYREPFFKHELVDIVLRARQEGVDLIIRAR